MSRCILFLGAVLALPAFAQTSDSAPAEPVPAQETPAAAPEVPATIAAPQMTPEQKLTQYRHDQINLLALHPDAESLIAATLLADVDADDKSRPAVLKSPALLKRTQSIGADKPLVWWVTAAAECHDKANACPSPQTLQKLENLDAENAAVWTLSLWRAQQIKDAPAARAALTSAAQAKRYDDYFGTLVSVLYEAQNVLPMSNDLLNATHADAGVSGYRLITAANIAVAKIALPGTRALADACKPGDADVAADCIAIARKMEQSGSLLIQEAGLALHEPLLSEAAEIDALHARRRGLQWQMQRMGELAPELANNSRVTHTYTQALAENGDESAAVRAVLRSQNVALDPPADWQPPQPAKAPIQP